MNDDTTKPKPPLTTSYIAHITLTKLRNQLEFSRKKLVERLGEVETQTEIDEGVIAQQFLFDVETILNSLSINTRGLRQHGPLNLTKLQDIEKVKELTKVFKDKSIELAEESERE